jgi:hypothetical protein
VKTGRNLICAGLRLGKPIHLTNKQRKSHETHHALSKPVALSPELQTKSSHSLSANAETEPYVPTGTAFRRKAAAGNCAVAQLPAGMVPDFVHA